MTWPSSESRCALPQAVTEEKACKAVACFRFAFGATLNVICMTRCLAKQLKVEANN